MLWTEILFTNFIMLAAEGCPLWLPRATLLLASLWRSANQNYSLFHIKGIFGVTIVFYFKCTLSITEYRFGRPTTNGNHLCIWNTRYIRENTKKIRISWLQIVNKKPKIVYTCSLNKIEESNKVGLNRSDENLFFWFLTYTQFHGQLRKLNKMIKNDVPRIVSLAVCDSPENTIWPLEQPSKNSFHIKSYYCNTYMYR